MHILTLQKKARARQAFLKWLAAYHPNVAAVADRGAGFGSALADLLPSYLTPPQDTRTEYVTAAPGSSAVIAQKTTTASPQAVAQQESWWQTVSKNISSALPQLATSYAQVRIINENLARARQGLPPLDSATVAPTVRVQAEASPQIMKIATIGIGVLAAALVLPKLLGAR